MPEAAYSDPRQPGSGQEPMGVPGRGTGGDRGARRLSLLDALGNRREGSILRWTRWDDGTTPALQDVKGDFRIVILSEPPQGPVHAPRGTVVCAPARPLGEPAAEREAAATYEVKPRQPHHLPTATEARLLSQGKLYAATELSIAPEEVFRGGKPRLDLLARHLLTSEALADYLEPLAVALAAPAPPTPGSVGERIAALAALLREAEAAVHGLDPAAGNEAAGALGRLSQLCAASDGQALLVSARRLYPQVPALLEDVYLARALAERLPEAVEVLTMRAFVSGAAVPPTDADLSLDKTIVAEQLRFASLVPEPQRLNAARAAMDCFRSRYRSRYEAHHRAYWAGMARLHARLLEAAGQAEALNKLNTLTELGPPVGEGALAAYQNLLDEASGCQLIVGVENELGQGAVCPDCALRLDQQPPVERVSEILQRIERAIGRQLARLSSVGVRQVLERSGDRRVEQFLKVVQASQISSLSEILDDELLGYLRRFLVESRIGAVLDPILSRLEEGTPPTGEEAQETLRELARVLQRAFRASGRTLPPTKPALKSGTAKKARR